MASPSIILGAVSGSVVVTTLVAGIVICYLRRKKRRKAAPPKYEAIGDCKPSSLVSLSTSSQMCFPDAQMCREAKQVQQIQPRLSSTFSRSSVKSDQFMDDTSSISARSDTSVDSNFFEATFGNIRPDLYVKKDAVLQQSSVETERHLGRLHIRLRYDFRTSDLVTHLIEAQDLPADELTGGFSDPYVKVVLDPPTDDKRRQSSVKRKTTNPVYNEYFKFPIPFDDLTVRSLIFVLYDYDKFSRHEPIGEVCVDMTHVDVSTSVEMWCDISVHQQISGSSGDLLVSLSYLPAAERLTIVVMKAKELRMPNIAGCDPYVRVSLITENKKPKRKKTTMRKGTVNPVWNEPLVFNVAAESLSKTILECVVLNHDIIGQGDVMGQCVLGPYLEGTAQAHWSDMLQSPRKAVAMWHPLCKGKTVP